MNILLSAKSVMFTIFLLLASIYMFYNIDETVDKLISYKKSTLINEANTHFEDQVNMRKWNAQYGGVYVKPLPNQYPNPYLVDNVLKVDDNLTLIKINPAWMTRQLSEIVEIKNYKFSITSLKTLNPHNKATEDEQIALKYMEKHNKSSHYWFSDETFYYMGALPTTQDCLKCHSKQGYKIGDIRGGITVELNAKDYLESIESLKQKELSRKLVLAIFVLSILFFYYKSLIRKGKLEEINEHLDEKVKEKTKEVGAIKQMLQSILDYEVNLIVVTNGENIIFANQTMFDFFGYKNYEEFVSKHKCICDFFEKVDDHPEYILAHMEQKDWARYLVDNQDENDLKVLFLIDGKKRVFKPVAKELMINNELIYLVIFNEITRFVDEQKRLKNLANTDPLTKLLNRRRFDELVSIEYGIALEDGSPLSIIFLDIDHFKNVNDNYGHSSGDEVLQEIAKIVKHGVRDTDIVARWGGEEFTIILPLTTKDKAYDIAEKIRKRVESHMFLAVFNVTASFGVSQLECDENIEKLLKRADDALFLAKESGRNRTEVDGGC